MFYSYNVRICTQICVCSTEKQMFFSAIELAIELDIIFLFVHSYGFFQPLIYILLQACQEQRINKYLTTKLYYVL